MNANGNEDTNDAKDTDDAEKEEVADEDIEEEEEVKPGQEKGCRCLQSFALSPAPINFFSFCCGGG